MSTENKEDLFEIKLTEVGRNYILKSARILGVSITLSLIMAAVQLFSNIYRMVNFSTLDSVRALGQTYKVANILSILAMGINIVAIIKYYSFVAGLKKSITKVDEGKFSLSFRHLFGNLIFLLIGLILHMIVTVIYILGPLGSLF